jgi:hypothetical protein
VIRAHLLGLTRPLPDLADDEYDRPDMEPPGHQAAAGRRSIWLPITIRYDPQWMAAPAGCDAYNRLSLRECRGRCQDGPYVVSTAILFIGCTADFRTGYTPTDAPMLRKKMIIESMKLPIHAPV